MLRIPQSQQVDFLEWARTRSRIPLFAEQGTGKTYMYCSWIEHLRTQPNLVLIDKSYISLLAAEIRQNTDLTAVELLGTKVQKLKLLQEPAAIYIGNYEIYRTIGRQLWEKGFETIIVDESTAIKDFRSKRARALYRWTRDTFNRMIATGTPFTNSLYDVWGQFKWLDDGETFGSTFMKFRSKYFFQSGFEWQLKSGSKELLRRIIERVSFRVTKEEVLHLPPQKFKLVPVNLSHKQKIFYNSLLENFMVQIEDQFYETRFIVAQLNKLLQICGGGFYMKGSSILDRYAIKFHSAKLSALKILLRKFAGKRQTVVWANYHFELQQIYAMCVKNGYKCRLMSENITKSVQDFQAGKVEVLVAPLSSGSKMINLTRASAVIYYSRGWSVLKRSQSEARSHRIGSEIHEDILYFDIYCRGTVDEWTIDETFQKRYLGNSLMTKKVIKKVFCGIDDDLKCS
jgi:SNF2 family DNA or RNA helicase